MTRVEPIPPRQWPSSIREALAALRPESPRHPFPPPDPSRPKGLNALGLLAHHPDLTRAYNTFNGHVLFASTIAPRQRELLVLRVAHLRQSDYEWAQHAVLAGDAGITDDEVEHVRIGSSAEGWQPLDRALLGAAEQLIDSARIDDDTWATLAAELDTQQIMDVIFTVGAYELLAMFFRSFDAQLDDDLLNRAGLSPEPGQ